MSVDDPFQLKDKSNVELHDWTALQESGTLEYKAGIEESMRRVAAMEEVMEKNEAPVWRRESIAMALSLLAIAVTIFIIVLLY
jgi:hypothetical protein